LLFYSVPAKLPAPQAAPCPAALFNDAHARCVAYLRQQEAERQAAKDFAKSLKDGSLFGAPAAEEAGAAEPLLLAEAPHFLGDFTVLDTEFQGETLLELAAVRYQNWQPVGQLLSFVRFAGEINYHVGKLTGITAADVRRAPDPKAVLQEFRRVAGDSLLVAHNSSADRRILEATRTRLGAAGPLPNPWLCTMAHARARYPAPHKLGDLCQRFGIPTAGAHRALNDVQMCFRLLQRMHAEQPITAALVRSKRKAAPSSTLFADAA
jgi:DNA polymerase-3 subunit epsilon